MQTVVGRFAPQLQQHFKREGNTLELDIDGLPVRFAPQERSDDMKPAVAASASVTEDEIDFGLTIGVIVVVLASGFATAAALLLLRTRHKRKESYCANSGSTHRFDRSSRAVTVVVNPLAVKGTPACNRGNSNAHPNPNGEEQSKESVVIEMSDLKDGERASGAGHILAI